MTSSVPARCFLALEECFCLWYSELETPSCLNGTFHTNLSQVSLETYLEGLRAIGAMKPKTQFSFTQGNETQNFNMQPVFNVQSFATGKRKFGPKMGNTLRCHDSRNLYIAGSCLHESGHIKHEGWNWTDTHMTNGSSLKATQPSFSTPPFPLTEGQCFAYVRGNRKFVAGPLRNFMEQITCQPRRNHLIFDKCSTEVKQLLAEGPSLKSEERWFSKSTIGDPKLKPFRQRPKKSTQFDAIILLR